MRNLKIAIIGMCHIHAHCLYNDFNRYSDKIEWLGCADTEDYDEERINKYKKLNFGEARGLKVYKNYKDLLDMKPDIAIICSDIASHGWIAEETLRRNIHTVFEKPMAIDMEDAKRMYRAYKKSNAELIINWPIAWFSAFRKAKKLTDSGIIGDVLRVQYRSPSTRGPYKLNEYTPAELSELWWYDHERGGGSIMDYAGYGCTLTTWFTGKIAKRVSGFRKNFFLPFSDVEDYSVFTIDFGDCIGLIEGSWSTMNNGEIATGPVIYGTDGVIVADRFSKEVKVYKDLVPYKPSPTPNEVYVTEDIDDNLALNVINFINNKAPLFELVTADFNMKAQAALDAGRRSCDTGLVENTIDPFNF